ncbi:MAG: hypothetical protein Q9159_003236 [Coniocarpon cinnabarinum]
MAGLPDTHIDESSVFTTSTTVTNTDSALDSRSSTNPSSRSSSGSSTTAFFTRDISNFFVKKMSPNKDFAKDSAKVTTASSSTTTTTNTAFVEPPKPSFTQSIMERAKATLHSAAFRKLSPSQKRSRRAFYLAQMQDDRRAKKVREEQEKAAAKKAEKEAVQRKAEKVAAAKKAKEEAAIKQAQEATLKKTAAEEEAAGPEKSREETASKQAEEKAALERAEEAKEAASSESADQDFTQSQSSPEVDMTTSEPITEEPDLASFEDIEHSSDLEGESSQSIGSDEEIIESITTSLPTASTSTEQLLQSTINRPDVNRGLESASNKKSKSQSESTTVDESNTMPRQKSTRVAAAVEKTTSAITNLRKRTREVFEPDGPRSTHSNDAGRPRKSMRLTDNEAEAVEAAQPEKPFRLSRIASKATTTVNSVLGKRSREDSEHDSQQLKKLLRKKQNGQRLTEGERLLLESELKKKETAISKEKKTLHIDENWTLQQIEELEVKFNLPKGWKPNIPEEELRALKKRKLEEKHGKAAVEEIDAVPEEDEEEKEPEEPPSAAPKPPKRKKYLKQGLYVGQHRGYDPKLNPEQNLKKLSKQGQAPKEDHSALPMPMFNGEKLMSSLREFKLPYDIFNPSPSGQPKPESFKKINKNRFVGEAAQLW